MICVLIMPALVATAFAAAVKIMPIGDSITLGNGSPSRGSYRAFLWNSLRETGANIDFVGPWCHGPAGIDCHHAGFDGWYIADDTTGPQRRDGVMRMVPWLMQQYRPDIALVCLGTNDILWYSDNMRAGAGQRMDAFLDTLRAHAPGIKIVVASLLPFNNDAMARYSEQYRQHLRQRSMERNNLYFADMFPAFPDPLKGGQQLQQWLSLIPDGIHPNDSGYRRMSTVWFPVVKELLTATGVLEGRNSAPRHLSFYPAPRVISRGVWAPRSGPAFDIRGKRLRPGDARMLVSIDGRLDPRE